MTEPVRATPRPASLRVLQRVVFPGDDLDVVPLYVETKMDRGAAELAADMLTSSLTGGKARRDQLGHHRPGGRGPDAASGSAWTCLAIRPRRAGPAAAR